MSSKCFITFLNTTTQTERSGSNSRLQPPCLHASHSSFLRRKVARGFAVPRHKPDSASASLDVGMSQSSTVDGVAAGSRHAVTTFADQFFTNAPKRPSALE